MQLPHRQTRSQRGSALAFFAVAVAAFMATAAVAVDLGNLFVHRQHLKVVADGAALAAARSLPDQSVAVAAASEILDRNGITGAEFTRSVTTSADGSSATVALTRQIPTLFARLLGLSAVTVPATSTAVGAPAGRVSGVAPFGIPNQSFVYGQQVTIKASNSNQYGLAGFFGALALGGTGASTYENNLANGYGQPLGVGDLVSLESGDMVGPTRRAVQQRLDQAPQETWTSYSAGSPRLIMVAVLDFSNVSGSGQARVLGFAAFFLESVSGGDIDGRYVRHVADAEAATTGTDYGLRVAKLT